MNTDYGKKVYDDGGDVSRMNDRELGTCLNSRCDITTPDHFRSRANSSGLFGMCNPPVDIFRGMHSGC